MRNPGFLWIIIIILVILDFYVFQAIKVALATATPRIRTTVVSLYWVFAVITAATLIAYPYIKQENISREARSYLFSMLVIIFFSKLLASMFLAMDDVRRGATWIVGKLFSNPSLEVNQSASGITRSVFLSWLGLAMGGGLFSSMIYGFSNKYNYHIFRLRLAFKNLPAAFKGLKIVHISDIHSGSLADKKAVKKGINKILKEKPDMILFTGDLVNDRAIELEELMDIFGELKAPMGVYSILGNHDYGDYIRWESETEKSDNLKRLQELQAKMGWRLLMNEHVLLEKEQEKIALIGVENWSAKGNFPKYGKLDEAYSGTEQVPFKLLMTHDPSHWDAEVRAQYKDIDLTLSGHTHGMQFGVELPGFKWSPVQYMYKQWAGLYEEQDQKLYINRGFGFIGYPGRVGILPEITVINLT